MDLSKLNKYEFPSSEEPEDEPSSAPEDVDSEEDLYDAIEIENFQPVIENYAGLTEQVKANLNERNWRKSLNDLKEMGKANNMLIEVAFKSAGGSFVKLPNICAGRYQCRRFNQDANDESFFTQMVCSEADDLCCKLLADEFPAPIYVHGSVGIGKSFLLYQAACKLLLKREQCRLIYVNKASQAIYEDYIDALASTLLGESDQEALQELSILFDKNGKFSFMTSTKQQSEAILKCIDALKRQGLKVISIIDQTDNVTDSPLGGESYHFMTSFLKSQTRCLFSGSPNDQFLAKRRHEFTLISLPVRIGIERMKLLIHQLFPRVAEQIGRSKSALEKIYKVTGGSYFQIALFCQVDAQDLSKRFKAYRNEFFSKFGSLLHSSYLGQENGVHHEDLKKDMAKMIDSALLYKPLEDPKNCRYDGYFMYIEEEENGIARAKFITPNSYDCIRNYYEPDLLTTPISDLGKFLKNDMLAQALDTNLSDDERDQAFKRYFMLNCISECKNQ